MPVFYYKKCGCLDNSSCGGTYWTKDTDIWPLEYRGKLLCCVCAPPTYADGTPNKAAGVWHNRFPRVYSKEGRS
jgi:hypothetical protein